VTPRRAFVLAGASLFLASLRVEAHPRMISYNHPNCISCHVSPQGRGPLKGYGRGIDIEQSFSDFDATGRLSGTLLDPKYSSDWNGQFGPTLLDFVATTRVNHEFDSQKTDPTFSALFRQAISLERNNASA
jgi:hypothetical protein